MLVAVDNFGPLPVLGLFLWDDANTDPNHRELDFEFVRGGPHCLVFLLILSLGLSVGCGLCRRSGRFWGCGCVQK